MALSQDSKSGTPLVETLSTTPQTQIGDAKKIDLRLLPIDSLRVSEKIEGYLGKEQVAKLNEKITGYETAKKHLEANSHSNNIYYIFLLNQIYADFPAHLLKISKKEDENQICHQFLIKLLTATAVFSDELLSSDYSSDIVYFLNIAIFENRNEEILAKIAEILIEINLDRIVPQQDNSKLINYLKNFSGFLRRAYTLVLVAINQDEKNSDAELVQLEQVANFPIVIKRGDEIHIYCGKDNEWKRNKLSAEEYVIFNKLPFNQCKKRIFDNVLFIKIEQDDPCLTTAIFNILKKYHTFLPNPHFKKAELFFCKNYQLATPAEKVKILRKNYSQIIKKFPDWHMTLEDEIFQYTSNSCVAREQLRDAAYTLLAMKDRLKLKDNQLACYFFQSAFVHADSVQQIELVYDAITKNQKMLADNMVVNYPTELSQDDVKELENYFLKKSGKDIKQISIERKAKLISANPADFVKDFKDAKREFKPPQELRRSIMFFNKKPKATFCDLLLLTKDAKETLSEEEKSFSKILNMPILVKNSENQFSIYGRHADKEWKVSNLPREKTSLFKDFPFEKAKLKRINKKNSLLTSPIISLLKESHVHIPIREHNDWLGIPNDADDKSNNETIMYYGEIARLFFPHTSPKYRHDKDDKYIFSKKSEVAPSLSTIIRKDVDERDDIAKQRDLILNNLKQLIKASRLSRFISIAMFSWFFQDDDSHFLNILQPAVKLNELTQQEVFVLTRIDFELFCAPLSFRLWREGMAYWEKRVIVGEPGIDFKIFFTEHVNVGKLSARDYSLFPVCRDFFPRRWDFDLISQADEKFSHTSQNEKHFFALKILLYRNILLEMLPIHFQHVPHRISQQKFIQSQSDNFEEICTQDPQFKEYIKKFSIRCPQIIFYELKLVFMENPHYKYEWQAITEDLMITFQRVYTKATGQPLSSDQGKAIVQFANDMDTLKKEAISQATKFYAEHNMSFDEAASLEALKQAQIDVPSIRIMLGR